MKKKFKHFFLLLIFFLFQWGMVYSSTLKEEPHDSLSFTKSIPVFSYEEIKKQYNQLNLTIDLSFNKKVYSFIEYFTIKNRDYTLRMMRKKELYFSLFEKYLKKYSLPDELKYLPIIESGLNPKAISRARAVGLWQFVRGTAKEYNLKMDWYIDERMDPEKSTEAACKHLKLLYDIFEDWKMALVAYNCGAGNVRKAIRRSGYKKNFWSVYRYLPKETRSYIPQLASVIYTLNNTEKHKLFVPDSSIYQPIEYETIVLNQFVYLNTLAKESQISLAVLKKLNPSVKKGAIPVTSKNFKLKIPKKESKVFYENKASILVKAAAAKKEFEKLERNVPGSTFGREKIIYRVKKGDVLGTIAHKYKVRIVDIKVWNNVKGSLIKIGQKLVIYIGSNLYSNETIARKKPRNLLIPPSKIHIVRYGDTLWDISRMYKGLTIEKIKKINKLKTNKIKPGKRLIIG